MAELEFLDKKLHTEWKFALQYGMLTLDVPEYIKSNLNPMFLDREYQKETISKFDWYLNRYKDKPKDKPIHLLFNMATGSGKTVLMAANMLELYTKGYRNFIFIVNSNNIIKKTIANFTEKGNSKYLFADKIIFDFREIQINQVDNFETNPANDINILFSTIQGLHTQLKEPREGGLTYESLQQTKLVMLSDEAHHLNTLTSSKKEKDLESSWEGTVNTIIENHPQNILLEYTATVDWKKQEIKEKYRDKILMRYSLKEFRNDRYSKEIKLIKSGINIHQRILQALVLNQYRLKVANDPANFIASPYLPFKPLILFKSASIAESEKCFEDFKLLLKNLKASEIKALEKSGGTTLKKAFDFFKQNGISVEQLTDEIKNDFQPDRCIIVNSENDSEAKQMELNNLEKNDFRAVFTVDMLKEGWDVLNLYDIVRLDEGNGRNAGGKPSASTLSEAQLIGRGARYFPFETKTENEMYQRKFDKNLKSDLRCLEELYYHSVNDNNYIDAITKELVEAGVYDPNQDNDPIIVKVRPSFKQTNLWNDGLIFTNEQLVKSNKHVTSLKQIHDTGLHYKEFVGTSGTDELVVFDEEAVKQDKELQKTFAGSVNRPIDLIKDLGLEVCLKATENIPFYNFDNLNRILPQLKSTRDFLTKDEWIAKAQITLIGSKDRLDNLQPKEKVRIAENVLRRIKNDISSNVTKYEGSKEFEGKPLKNYFLDKHGEEREIQMMVSEPEADSKKQFGKSMTYNDKEEFRLNLKDETANWYVFDDNYGTSEEKYLVKYIAEALDKLKENYTDIYLLRNEKLFKIYAFEDGSAFEPDFVLFMKEKKTAKKLSYQLFIEPKGDQFRDEDDNFEKGKEGWKEKFLHDINIKAKIKKVEILYEDDKFKVFGLPFYNNRTQNVFIKKFKEVLKVE